MRWRRVGGGPISQTASSRYGSILSVNADTYVRWAIRLYSPLVMGRGWSTSALLIAVIEIMRSPVHASMNSESSGWAWRYRRMALHKAIVPLIWSGGGAVASIILARTISESAGEGGKRVRSSFIWEGVGDGELEASL